MTKVSNLFGRGLWLVAAVRSRGAKRLSSFHFKFSNFSLFACFIFHTNISFQKFSYHMHIVSHSCIEQIWSKLQFTSALTLLKLTNRVLPSRQMKKRNISLGLRTKSKFCTMYKYLLIFSDRLSWQKYAYAPVSFEV